MSLTEVWLTSDGALFLKNNRNVFYFVKMTKFEMVRESITHWLISFWLPPSLFFNTEVDDVVGESGAGEEPPMKTRQQLDLSL